MRIDRKAASMAWPMAGLVLVLTAGVTRAAPPADAGADEAHIRRLVRQLGDDSYEARERAQKELLKIGPPAIPFLEKALAESTDPEVKLRTEQILPEARRQAAKLLGERIKKNLLWKIPLKAGPAGDLVAAPGVVLVGSTAGGLAAVDASTGKVRWRAATKAGGAVMADGATAFVVDNASRLQALDLKTGKPRAGFEARKVAGPAALADGVIYARVSDKTFQALDARTGQPTWGAGSGGKAGPGAAPVVSGKTLFARVGRAGVLAVERATGKTLWKTSLGGLCPNALAVCGDKLIAQIDAQACALDAATGKMLWRSSITQGATNIRMMGRLAANGQVITISLAGAGHPGMAVRGDTVYVATGGQVVAVDADTGEKKWSYRHKPDRDAGKAGEGGAHAGWVQVFGGGANGGVQIHPEGIIRPVVARGFAGLTAPLVMDEVVYVGSAKGLVALDSKTGEQLWVFTTSESVTAGPAIGGGVIYFATSEAGEKGRSHLHAVRLKEAK